jgi:hypothetical protein
MACKSRSSDAAWKRREWRIEMAVVLAWMWLGNA